MIAELALYLGSAVGLTAAMTPLAAGLAKRVGAMAIPAGRHGHALATPRLGGLAIAVSFAIVVALAVANMPLSWLTDLHLSSGQVYLLLLGAGLILLGGGLDDILDFAPSTKLTVQLAGAVLAYFGSASIGSVYIPGLGSTPLGAADFPASVIWMLAITNAINLLDGLDGLAAGVTAVIATAMGAVAFGLGNPAFAVICFVLAGASCGFLVHNFHPARVFMGDSGSNFLGFCLGCLSLIGNRKNVAAVGLAASFIILGLPMLDMLFSMLRRTMQGRSPFSADRGHLHHMLVTLGLSQRRVALILYVVSLALGILGIVGALAGKPVVGYVLITMLALAAITYRLFGFRMWNDLLRQRSWHRAVKKTSAALVPGVNLNRSWKSLAAVLRLMGFGAAELHVYKEDGQPVELFSRSLEANPNGTTSMPPVCLDLRRNGRLRARLYLRDRKPRTVSMMYRVAILRPLLDSFEEYLHTSTATSTDLRAG